LKSRGKTLKGLTISEVARRSGLRASAIRYYESLDLLPAAQRVSGQRRFEPEIIERLAFIQTASRLGFSLTEIRSLLQEQPALTPLTERWQMLARQRLSEVKALIQEAQSIQQRLEVGLGCACSNVEDCIDCVLANCQE
jgi:MerR family transcriptional regulator, redox-sensitive transcriptional activator SoxR